MPHSEKQQVATVYIQATRRIILSGVVTLSETLGWSNRIQEQGEYWASFTVYSLLVLLFDKSCVPNGSQVWNLHLQRDSVYDGVQNICKNKGLIKH